MLMAKLVDNFKSFFVKKTLSMTNKNRETEWSFRISMAALVGGLATFCVLLFVIILMLVAYTPILDIFPGYLTAAEKHHNELVHSIMRIDSLERSMVLMRQYSDDVPPYVDS